MNFNSLFSRWITPATYLATISFGILALIYPFLSLYFGQDDYSSSNMVSGVPIIQSVLLGLCLLVLIYIVQGNRLNTKVIALLGILVAFNAALRFIEVGIPGPGGFSPVFFLIIMTGYVFGAQFGFLMGALTMLVSAIITGGIGPWLPGQMLSAGWVGISAALLAPVLMLIKNNPKISSKTNYQKIELSVLIIFGFIWGIAYGVIMNLWTWPYIIGPQNQFITNGMNISSMVDKYLSYYVVTSLIWDISRSFGNAIILLALGIPTLKALRRFHGRFSFSYIQSKTQPEKSREINLDDITQPLNTQS